MKKNLLLFLLMFSSISFVFSQTPCVADYQVNNGGGNCPDLAGNSATGTITLTFDGPVDPLNIATIVSVFDITDPLNPVLVTDIVYGAGELLNNGDVKYCYYVGPANNNNLSGRNSRFRFLIVYAGGALCVEGATLPVSFAAFTAARSSSVVSLKWTTATESNNLGFEIQRSDYWKSEESKRNWITVGFIEGSGTSTERKNYSFTDKNPIPGTSFYRLKQIDFDGTFKFFNEVKVLVTAVKDYELAQNYPNPFNPSTTIDYSIPVTGHVSLKVYNLLGSEVAVLVDNVQEAGKHSIEFSTKDLDSKIGSGVYLYTLRSGEFVKTRKMIILK